MSVYQVEYNNPYGGKSYESGFVTYARAYAWAVKHCLGWWVIARDYGEGRKGK